MTPSYGWAPIGEPCEYVVNKLKNKRFSLLIGMNRATVVDYVIKEGSINTVDYKQFIENITKNRKNVAILMDNASIHHSKVCKELYKKRNIETIFNVAYMPEFNPIEYLNNKVKSFFKRSENDSVKSLKEQLINAINTVNRNDLVNFFNKSFSNLDKKIKELTNNN